MPIAHRGSLRRQRRIIEERYGVERAGHERWIVAGDFNDYRERVVISEDEAGDYAFEVRRETGTSVDVLAAEGFGENMVESAPRSRPLDAVSLARAPGAASLPARLSDRLAGRWPMQIAARCPTSFARASPHRTIFPPGQDVERYPRTGWDKAQGLRPIVRRGLPVIGLRRTVFTLGS